MVDVIHMNRKEIWEVGHIKHIKRITLYEHWKLDMVANLSRLVCGEFINGEM